jgi:hypothetical protein
MTIRAKKFDRAMIKKMVQAYRRSVADNPMALKYSHFNAYDILDLYISNKIVSTSLAQAILSEKSDIEKFGLKIYLGQNVEGSFDPIIHPDYLGYTTTILCNTIIEPDSAYGYLLKDILGPVSGIAQRDEDSDEEGLDQAEICPPYHEDAPEDEEYDVGFPL